MPIRVLQGSRIDFSPRPSDIPEVRTRIPEQRHIPSRSQSASAIQSLGNTIVSVGDTLGQVGRIDQQRDEKRQADALELNFKNRLFELQYGSADGTTKGFANERGQEFFDAAPEYHRQVEIARQDVMRLSGNSPVVASEVSRVTAQHQFSARVTHAAQGTQQRRAAEIATDAAFIQSDIRDIVASGITGAISRNPQTLEEQLLQSRHLSTLASIVARTNELADRMGIANDERGKEARRIMIEDNLTAAHKGVIDQFLGKGEATQAEDYFKAWQHQIEPTARGALAKDIRGGVTTEDARRIVTAAKAYPTAKARREYVIKESAKFSADVQKEALQDLRLHEAALKAEKLEADNTLKDEINLRTENGEDPTTWPPALVKEAKRLNMYTLAKEEHVKIKNNEHRNAHPAVMQLIDRMEDNDTLKDWKEIHDPKTRALLGKDYLPVLSRYYTARGENKKAEKAHLQTAKDSRKIGPLMTASADARKAASYNDTQNTAFRRGLNLMLAELDPTQELTPVQQDDLIERAMQQVTHLGSGYIWDDSVTVAEAKAIQAKDPTAKFQIPDLQEFLDRTVAATGVPEKFARAAALQMKAAGLTVSATAIQQAHTRALRKARQDKVIAAEKKGPPPNVSPLTGQPRPAVPAFDDASRAALKELVDAEVAQQPAQEQADLLNRIQAALAEPTSVPVLEGGGDDTSDDDDLPTAIPPEEASEEIPLNREELTTAKKIALDKLEKEATGGKKHTSKQVAAAVKKAEDKLRAEKFTAQKLDEIVKEEAVRRAAKEKSDAAKKKARKEKILDQNRRRRDRLAKQKAGGAAVQALRAELANPSAEKKSEEVAVTGRDTRGAIQTLAGVWDVAYQGNKKGEAAVDLAKQRSFIQHVEQFRDTADPAVTKVIFDTVATAFAGDEGTDVAKVQNAVWYTALHESLGYKFRKQRGGGPARGIHQVEPATALSLIKNSALLGPTARRLLLAEGLDINKKVTKKQLGDALQQSDVVSTIFATAKLLSGAKRHKRLGELS